MNGFTPDDGAERTPSINHDVAKRAAQDLIDRAEKFSIAELHKADMAGVVGLSLAYLDLAAQLEAANANADELQSRLDTVTASHCEMLRELQAERQRVKELEAALGEAIECADPIQCDINRLTAIKEGRHE